MLTPKTAHIVALTLWPEWGAAFDLPHRPKRVENRLWAVERSWIAGRVILLHGGKAIGGGRRKREACQDVIEAATCAGARVPPTVEQMEGYRGRAFGVARVRAVAHGQRVPWARGWAGQILLEEYVSLPPGIEMQGRQGLFVPPSEVVEQVASVVEGCRHGWETPLTQRKVSPMGSGGWPWAWACKGLEGEGHGYTPEICANLASLCAHKACRREPIRSGTVHDWIGLATGPWLCRTCGFERKTDPRRVSPQSSEAAGMCAGGPYVRLKERGELRLWQQLTPAERGRVADGQLWPVAWCGGRPHFRPLFARGAGGRG